jgi:hypothetical protein
VMVRKGPFVEVASCLACTFRASFLPTLILPSLLHFQVKTDSRWSVHRSLRPSSDIRMSCWLIVLLSPFAFVAQPNFSLSCLRPRPSLSSDDPSTSVDLLPKRFDNLLRPPRKSHESPRRRSPLWDPRSLRESLVRLFVFSLSCSFLPLASSQQS